MDYDLDDDIDFFEFKRILINSEAILSKKTTLVSDISSISNF